MVKDQGNVVINLLDDQMRTFEPLCSGENSIAHVVQEVHKQNAVMLHHCKRCSCSACKAGTSTQIPV